MKAAEILHELYARGVVVEAAGNQLRLEAPKGALTPELRGAISEQKREILLLVVRCDPEVTWRMKVMLAQVPNRGYIPFLVARTGIEGQTGHCLSCGDRLNSGDAFRCSPCGRAANLALELYMSGHSNEPNQGEQ